MMRSTVLQRPLLLLWEQTGLTSHSVSKVSKIKEAMK